MKPRRLIAVLLAALAMTVPRLAAAQSTLVDLEVGYQWVDVSGNQDMYRTQVNQDDGFVLRDLSLTTLSTEGLFDRLQIDAAGFGGNPNGGFRIAVGRARGYHLGLSYRRMDAFSALPELANPMLGEGTLPGQHTFDRTREVVDVELELFPGHTLSPFVGYRSNSLDGNRRTTRHVGEDEFQLASRIKETEEEYYAGLSFAAGTFSGSLTQGWRSFSGHETVGLLAGAGNGNNLRAVLGEDIVLDDYQRQTRTDVDTPVTTGLLNGRIGERVRLKATFAYADADADSSESELLSGSLASFQLSRFFGSLDESATSGAKSPAWRADLAASVDLTQTMVLDASYDTRDREVRGWALVESLYLDTLNFSGADPADISRLVESRTTLDRTDSAGSLRLTARQLGPFSAWAEYRLVDQKIDLDEDPAEIVVPGAQEGSFERSVDSYALGLALSVPTVDASLEWRGEDADRAVVRTDFDTRDRFRLRVGWKPCSHFQLTGTAENVEASNPTADVAYDADTDHYALMAFFEVAKELTFRLGYDSYSTDSSILIRRPQDFTVTPSLHSEDGDGYEAGLTWTHGRFNLDGSYSRYENSGSFAFALDHLSARLGLDLTSTIATAVEYETFDYTEDFFAAADFDSARYGLFLRFRL
jgi:hypothetical protein